MNTTSKSTAIDGLNRGQLEQLDALCDQFEADWQRATSPCIESFLDKLGIAVDRAASDNVEPFHRALLEELISIDLHWRARHSDVRRLHADYSRRFPCCAPFLRGLIQHQNGLTSSPLPSSPTRALGPFREMEKIGEGGFGVVFRAWDSRHGRWVALKLPRFGSGFGNTDLHRFLREARAAGSLDHPGIARVWDSGQVEGMTYIAYQFVEGDDLKTRLSEIAGLTPQKIAAFVAALADAAHFAHQRGIIHRDIKPSNVLLDADNQPVLTDFGVAIAIADDVTRSWAVRVGTLDYMSPEQASGNRDHLDHRTDLWSIGVVLYELLSGKRPFEGDSDAELIDRIAHSEPKRLRIVNRLIPRDLETIVARCLEKSPGDRLVSCGVLASELQRIARGEPIESRPVSFVERSGRWCQRNPKALATFLAVLLATTFGTFSWAWRLTDARKNETAVRELNLAIEAKDIERRRLIRDILLQHVDMLNFADDDLPYIETLMFDPEFTSVQRQAVNILLQRRFLSASRWEGTDRRQKAAQILREFPRDALDPDTRNYLESVLAALRSTTNDKATAD
ncbi:MAG: serine/threonine-protein kinase [Pirellulaceae bacterium]